MKLFRRILLMLIIVGLIKLSPAMSQECNVTENLDLDSNLESWQQREQGEFFPVRDIEIQYEELRGQLLFEQGFTFNVLDLETGNVIRYSTPVDVGNISQNPQLQNIIAFGSDHIYLLNTETQRLIRVSPPIDDIYPNRPSGHSVTWGHCGDVVVYDRAMRVGTDINYLVLQNQEHQLIDVANTYGESYFMWNHDLSMLFFTANDSASDTTNRGLYSIPIYCWLKETCNATLVRDLSNLFVRDMVLSPDGTRIAFAGWESNKNAIFSIYVFDISNNTLTQLTDKQEVIDLYPTWSPDGKSIAFIRDDTPSLGDFPKELMVIELNDQLTMHTVIANFPGSQITWTK